MTDDFQLFPDPSGDPMDADIALITAYLARELSPVQIVAVEDRLAKDAEFRNKVRPVIDAWVLPSRLGAPVVAAGSLTKDEVEKGWQRYIAGRAELDAHDGPRLVVEGTQPKRRKISMTRIAAGIAAVTLPLIALAQVAVYIAKSPGAPGHSVVRDVVAPFTNPAPEAPTAARPEKPLQAPVDVPVGRQLEKPTQTVQRAARAEVKVAETPAAPTQPPKPDRAKISGLATKHHGNVVRGDTNANYIVMVLNSRGEHVWSTSGHGSAMVEITGDTRTLSERLAFMREHATEYTGNAPGTFAGGFGRGGGGGGGAVRARPVDSLASVRPPLDSVAPVVRSRASGSGGGGGGGGARGGMVGRVDTARLSDSVALRVASMVRASRSSGVSIGDMIATDSTGGRYRLAFGVMRDFEYSNVNEAPGLQLPGNGESGVQGLKSASVTFGESYQFAAGQLSPNGLRIFVLHLAPGTTWKGR